MRLHPAATVGLVRLGSCLPSSVSVTVGVAVMIENPLMTHQLNWTLRTDRAMYVANAGGTPRVDPDQVTFGRVSIIMAKPTEAHQPIPGRWRILAEANKKDTVRRQRQQI